MCLIMDIQALQTGYNGGMAIPDSPKRIYHFLLDHRLGGPHVFVKSICKPLRDRGNYDFTIVTTGRGLITELSLVNLRHFWFPLYALEVVINCLLIVWYGATRKIERKDALFHIHGAANIAPVLGAFILRIPVVWHFHDVVPGIRPLVKLGLAFISGTKHKLATVTEKSVEVYGLPKTILIQAPVDLDYWQGERDPERSVGDPFRIVNTANLNALKGQDVLLEALGRLGGKWELSLIGAFLETHASYGELLWIRAQEIERNNPSCKVKFMGWQERDRIREQLCACDVFVLPSRNEACPIALLEAMAMGKVCIASNVGGIEKVISNPELGHLVAPEQPELLLNALIAVRSMSQESAALMGERARKHISSDYSVSNIADKVLALYEEILGS
jgi:glycosyltransferase involved in cell wall biosynthesis